VLIVSASMGAGHTGISAELARQLGQRGHESRTVDFIDALPAGYGRAMRAIYRSQLRYAPWTYDAMYRLRFRYPHLWGEINAWYLLLSRRRLLRWVAEVEADVVLSVYPLASAVLGELRRRRRLPIPVLTYITDLGVHPLWVNGGVDLHLAVHPEAAWQAARRAGGPACTCAPLVGRPFLEAADRSQARARLGFDADQPLALVVGGSWGVGEIEPTVEAVAAAGFHPITLCGSDSALRRRITDLGVGVALGWTDDMATLMAAANVLVENAGGLSCMEAFAAGLPVVTYRPIAGHGRHNAREMERAGLTVWAKTPDELGEALGRLDRSDGWAAHQVARSLFGTQQVSSVIETVCRVPAMAVSPGNGAAVMTAGPPAARRTVVAGGAGTVGAGVVAGLVRSGREVAIVDQDVPQRADLTYWAVDPDDVDGLVMATAGADTVYHVPAVDGDHREAAQLWEACRRNGVEQAVIVNPASGHPVAVDRLEPAVSGPDERAPAPAPARPRSRSEGMAASLAGASLAVLLVAALVPTSGTPMAARVMAAGASALAAAAAWLEARRTAIRVPTVLGAGGALAAVWLLSQSTGGLSTVVSAVLLGFFIGAPFARLPAATAAATRRTAVGAAAAVLAVAVIAHAALFWLAAGLAMGGPAALLLGRTPPRWPSWRPAWWGPGTSVALAVTAVLATWVGANSAGATLVNHGSRRSQEVAITFDGLSDPQTMQRLLGVLDGSGIRATFFVPPPELRAAPQAGSLLLARDQLLGVQAHPRDWGAWLDPDYRQLTRAQRLFESEAGVCPAFFRSADNRPPPMMAAAVHRHDMTMVTWDVSTRAGADPSQTVQRVLAGVRPGSIVALSLETNAGGPGAASTVVQALPQILEGLRARDLQPVPLDQLLHVAPYASRC
jgi:UDP-N-acetylglucosamine:LPS N-acetylglucosamine transferase/peptidoglycan/xylan/chitin deacetylase (PgdA/CDA1 family)